ncbi:MAG: hypothetical protein Q9159_002161 [Coniocarpon cinnabarinum]
MQDDDTTSTYFAGCEQSLVLVIREYLAGHIPNIAWGPCKSKAAVIEDRRMLATTFGQSGVFARNPINSSNAHSTASPSSELWKCHLVSYAGPSRVTTAPPTISERFRATDTRTVSHKEAREASIAYALRAKLSVEA